MFQKLCAVNIKANKLLSCLSVCTMCLLVFTTIIIFTIISITPIIILGLGEISAGQRDLILYPTGDYLNSTKVGDLSGEIVMPRISVPALFDGNFGNLWFIDFTLEDHQHLGNIPAPPPGNHYIWLHKQFDIDKGQTVKVQLRQVNVLYALRNQLGQDPTTNPKLISELDYFINKLTPTAQFIVYGVFSDAYGKFPLGSVSGFSYADINTDYVYIVESTYRHYGMATSKSVLIEYLRSEFKLSEYSTEIVINIANRIQIYSNSNYDATYNKLSEFGANVLEKVGLFAVQSEVPIAANLLDMSYFGMFIGVILKLIVVTLFVLSVLMMNNMLEVGVERKSFDLAVLKTMGANRLFVVVSLLADYMKYVLLANVIAFPFAYICLYALSALFEDFFGYQYQVQPTFSAIVGGFLIGVLVPIVSSLIPIWGVVKDDLAQNLNPTLNKTQAIRTEIYIEGAQFPLGKIIFGILATCFGMMIYYLLPKGMMEEDIAMLLFIFFAILSGLLGGLILLSYSFQYMFEKFVAYVCLFWINKTDLMLTLKNLSAHRLKNRRSSLLYALSVAFIIFVSVGISIQIQTIEDALLKKHGTYIQIKAATGGLDRLYYDKLLAEQDDIQEWAYMTRKLSSQLAKYGVKKTLMCDKARLYFRDLSLYGVSPNYLSVLAYQNKLPLYSTKAYTPYDPYSFLYTEDGYMTSTISYYIAKKFNILDLESARYDLNLYTDTQMEKTELRASSVFTSRVGLGYSRFMFGSNEVAVSFDTYMKIAKVPTYASLPLSKIKVRVAPGTNTTNLTNSLRKDMAENNHDYVWDFSEVQGTITKINNLLNQVLNILLVLVLIISLFSLVTTSYVNIRNQYPEIGILMTLGYNKSRILRIYIFEAFVLVLSSCLIGIAVGFVVAWLMGSQRELFGNFPVIVQVNGLWIIAIAAIISSILSTVHPIYHLFTKSITQVFRSS